MKCELKVSTTLEDLATEVQRSQGFDIADYIIEEIKATTPVIQNRFTPELQSMTVENPAVLILIDALELIEITH